MTETLFCLDVWAPCEDGQSVGISAPQYRNRINAESLHNTQLRELFSMRDTRQPIHVNKPERVRHLGTFDIQLIASRLARFSETAWASEDSVKPNNFACFRGTTRHIILRFPDSNEDVGQYSDRPGWQIWKDLLQPLMEEAAQPYGYKKPLYSKAMFARLEAGKCISPHIDAPEINRR